MKRKLFRAVFCAGVLTLALTGLALAAEDSYTVDGADGVVDYVTGEGYYTASASGAKLQAGREYVLLVVKKPAAGGSVSLDPSQILYMDQQLAVSDRGTTAVNFDFEPAAVEESLVLLGGVFTDAPSPLTLGEITELPEGVAVSGSVTAWNAANDARVRLYDAAVAEAAVRADIASDAPALGTAAVLGAPEAAAAGYAQTFGFGPVLPGEYRLAVYKPGHVVSVEALSVSGAALTDQNVTLRRMGDLNGDGRVSVIDAVKLARALSPKETLTDLETAAADVTGDGHVNDADAQKLADVLTHQTGATLSAVGEDASGELAAASATFTVDAVRGLRGQSVTVPVRIADNPGVAGFALRLAYDANALTLTNITADPALAGGALHANLADGCLLWVCDENVTANGVLVNLTFTIKALSPLGLYPVTPSLTDDEESNVANTAYAAVPAELESGSVWSCAALLSGGAISGRSLSFDLSVNTADPPLADVRLYAALYDADGKMVYCKKLTPAQGRVSATLSYTGTYASCKVFAADATLSPLGEPLTISHA